LAVDRRDEVERELLPRSLKFTAVALSCALATLVVATVLFARQAALVRDATAEEMALNDWQGRLQSVLVSLIDAETGQRGYLLTGNARYLVPYNAAIHDIPMTLDSLREVPIADPSLPVHLSAIEERASAKIRELTETIRLRESGAMLEALAIVRTDAGLGQLHRLRGDSREVTAVVAAHRQAMNDRVVRGSLKTERLAVMTAVALVAVILLAGMEIWLLLGARSRQTRALKELAEVFDHTPDFVAQADWMGRMLYLNPAARRALRLAEDADIKGRAFSEFFTDETNRRWMPEIIPAAKRDGVWLGETAVRLPRGAVPVNHMVIAHHGSLGRVVRYTSIMRDISEQVTTRAELARQTATLNAIVESIPANVVVWDTDLRYRLVNREFERSRGRREDFIGLKFEDAWGPDEYERSIPWLRRALAGETVSHEMDYQQPSGSQHVLATYTPLHLEDGTVGGVIGVAQDITQHREENLRLTLLSERDPLTGLMNRTGFEAYLEKKVSEGDGASVGVLYVDLDNFKPVNDRYGHSTGDEVLRQLAARLQGAVRPTDVVARLGGDEFAIALAGLHGAADADAVAHKVVSLARQEFQLGGRTVTISASVGIAFDADAQGGWKNLVNQADAMAYEAKAQGRGRSALFGRDGTSTTRIQRKLQKG
jgi:diguanylate cyclase (GGDEF)-like protein/PAS domain S-box-containing protein